MPYNPGQLRIPRYHEGGGRFTADHNWVPLTPHTDDPRVILTRALSPPATAVRPPPNLRPQPAIPGSALPGTPGFRPPGMPSPALPWMPGSPAQLTAPGSPLLWDPSPLLDPTVPGRPRSPLQEVDLLSHQLYWYAVLSAGNNAYQRVALVRDREAYRANPRDPITLLKAFTSEQLSEICQRLGTVQDLTNTAFLHVMNTKGNMYTPQRIGTEVHWEVKEGIEKPPRKQPDLFAEISFMKTLFETGQLPLQRDTEGKALSPSVTYGRRGSIRIDALESRDAETVCVYDIKTGRNTLSLARMWELADTISRKFPAAKRIFVTEVRPLQWR